MVREKGYVVAQQDDIPTICPGFAGYLEEG
jgi:hypothetical protein